MASRADLPTKVVSETKNYLFDFTSQLGDTETISTKTVTASVYSGTDASPSSIVNGAASASGTVVSQSITAGTEGVMYELKCTITTSLGQTLAQIGYLAVLPELT